MEGSLIKKKNIAKNRLFSVFSTFHTILSKNNFCIFLKIYWKKKFHIKIGRWPPNLTPYINVVYWDLSKYNICTVRGQKIIYVFFFPKFLDPKSQTYRCDGVKRTSFFNSAYPTYIYYIPLPWSSDIPFGQKFFFRNP